MNQTCLMLGAGHAAPRRHFSAPSSAKQEDTKWVTLDNNEDAKPDMVFDLETLETGRHRPWTDETFDEIHAYEVLEHIGRQGDFKGLFSTFRALWYARKSDGMLIGSCPSLDSEWLWSDPGHTRVISAGLLSFLTRGHYDQLGKTPSSDYRKFIDPCWWEVYQAKDIKLGPGGGIFVFALKKVQ